MATASGAAPTALRPAPEDRSTLANARALRFRLLFVKIMLSILVGLARVGSSPRGCRFYFFFWCQSAWF